ncbi:PREDICTED: 11-beta-hydroxysteroid dehydrogenase-like 6 [Populus euphratica]|uniref:11-beta-hydroxysteroid dehydrogenase-like 6 n=1 Tax=Populus euphratica TaxID=75702 RepID=A0AAJ6UQ71_POPEU|nr:PREDICTED: 11-beta-hydroxysteroid dehydrogenase-like 6 [Populus euphratica]
MAMTSIHKLLNIVFPLMIIISILVILPPYLVFKLLSYIKRSMFTENVAGKVVLITGASSGIGEGLAYEYARRGAGLALVARREDFLRKSRGKIVAITSVAAWVPTPRATFYNASKAALVSFYETLRVECDSHIGITIVLPGLIESEMTVPDSLSKFQAKFLPPIESTRQCAEAIVHSACRGDMYLTEPSWSSSLFMLKLLCPELFDWFYRWNFMSGSKIDQL